MIRWSIALCLVAAAWGQPQPGSGSSSNWPCVDALRVDPTYLATSEATGGQTYFLHPSEAGRTADLMLWGMDHEELIWRAFGQIESGKREFHFPVDSMVESLFVSVWIQCKDSVEIVPPENGEGGFETLEFQAGRVIRVRKPKPGLWIVRISGRGLWTAVAEAKSDLTLDAARFVRWGGRPGHQGWFRLEGPPVMGTDQVLQVDLSGTATDLRYSLVDASGQELETVTGSDFLLRFPLRHSGFRLAVEGRDQNGFPFRRMTPAVFVAVDR